jgi:hypothetical protein
LKTLLQAITPHPRPQTMERGESVVLKPLSNLLERGLG